MANARRTKRDVDQAKKDKAALKRERRQLLRDESPDPTDLGAASDSSPTLTPERDVLEALNLLHVRFAAGELGFEDFEAAKTELLSQLTSPRSP
jgi:hypothetical protein